MKKLKDVLWCVLACLVMFSCGQAGDHRNQPHLDGAWSIQRVSYPYPDDYTKEYPADGLTFLRIYEGDTLCHECQLMATASGIAIMPMGSFHVTLIDKGNGQYLYIEEDEPRPLTFQGDTAMTIQRYGRVSLWTRNHEMTPQRIAEIRDIIVMDRERDADEQVRGYVLSTTERELRADKHRLIYSLIAACLLLIVTIRIVVKKQRRIRQAEERLRQIEEERQQRPMPVAEAMRSVETDFFSSDYYLQLRRRMATGERLHETEWEEAERRLQQVYPGFLTHLRGLYRMSELEHRVCLLIKLRFTPSEMASVLARDASTISTVRSRLYQKVFGRKGSSKQWDDIVLAIGT